MIIDFEGVAVGKPFRNKKNTGWLQKAIKVVDGRFSDEVMIYSGSGPVAVDQKGFIRGQFDLPEGFMFVPSEG